MQIPNFKIDEKPNSWLQAFHLLGEALESLQKQEKMIVFLDELP